MKKIISTVAFCAVSMTAVNVQAALNEAEILRKLEYLQRKVETQRQKLDAQQVTINELKEQITLAPLRTEYRRYYMGISISRSALPK